MAFNGRGEEVKTAVLTEARVLEMRRLYATGLESISTLAERFGVSKSCAARVLSGEAWSHLPTMARPSAEQSQALRSRKCWAARRASQAMR